MAYSYPILLDLTGKLVVIVGGGMVAVRKATGLIDGGATRIRCIAPQIVDVMPERVERVLAKFEPSQLDGAALVFAATDSTEVNFDIARAARERRILVSRVDDDDHGDFVLPANWRRGQIVVSVSTGSPTLSAELRDELERNFPSIRKYEQMAEWMQRLRPWIYNSSLDRLRQVNALFDLASPLALEILDKTGGEGLYRWLVEMYPQLKLEKAP